MKVPLSSEAQEGHSFGRMDLKTRFESGSDLENEPLVDNEEPTEFPCNVCHASFVTRMSLIRHMILHEDDDQSEHDIKKEVKKEPENTCSKESFDFPKIPEQNLLEAILKNGSKALMSGMAPNTPSANADSKKTANGSTSRPVPNLKPLPSLIQIQNDQPGKNFQCQMCGVCFWKKEDLSRHVTRTHGGAKFTCPYCNRNISRRDHLKRHIKNVHPEFCTATEVGPFINNPAGRPKKTSLESSITPDVGEPSHKKQKLSSTNLATIKVETTNDSLLEASIKDSQEMDLSHTKHFQNPYIDEQKLHNFIESNGLQHFLEDSEEGNFEREEAEVEDDDQGNTNGGQVDFPSSEDDCMDEGEYDMSAGIGEDLNLENQAEYGELSEELIPEVKTPIAGVSNERKFKCELCEAAFMSKINMQRHMSTHLIIRPHKCTVCGKGFLRKEHLTKHLSSVHSGLKYRCQFCGKDISRKDHLLRHIRNCHPLEFMGMPPEMIDSEPQIAQVPAVTLSNNPNMRVAALSCDMCSEIFNHIDELLEHQSDVHSDIRKFKCEECPKAFKRKEHLVKHQSTHLVPLPKTYSCTECNMVFNSLELAQVHLRQAHRNNASANGNGTASTLHCNLCDNTFQQRAHLLQHLKAYHGVSDPERRFLDGPFPSHSGKPMNSKPKLLSSRSPLVGKPQIHSLLGLNSAVSGSKEGNLGSLMGLIRTGSISLSLSKFQEKL